MKAVILVNGKPTEAAPGADVVEIGVGLFSVILDGCSYDVAVTGAAVDIDGTVLEVEIRDPRKWNSTGVSRKTEGLEAIKAPMPGKVVRVLVAVGDEVAAGQGLVVLEAMKMQNEMKAPRAGRVASLAVKEHEAVNAGSVLLTIS